MKIQFVIQAILLTVLVTFASARGSTAAAVVAAQRPPLPPQHKQSLALDTGVQLGDTAERGGPAFREVVRVPNAPWLRLHISDYKLGTGSYLMLTSLEDGGAQRLDAGSLPQWYNATAFFNGDAVLVELYVAPDDEGAFVRFDELTVGERGPAPSIDGATPNAPSSLCGADNRVVSTQSRVGRLYAGGCTAWLVSNGAVLTAGHCADFDPDQGGPLLPDGSLDLSGVVEFNVPASDPDGTPNLAAPNDQYPINTTNVSWRFDGEGQGLGKDWTVFGINPNSNTGLRAHVVQGFFRTTDLNPAGGDTIRITGFGVDNGTANYTNQTATGPYQGESSSGANFWHRYKTDTQPASSGSPIIWESNGFTVGIHTNGGCNADGSGENSGTSFEVNALETALQTFPANNTRYVDSVSSYSPVENGLIFQPYNSVNEAVASVPAGGTVSIVAGTYTEGAQTLNKAVTLEAPVGTAVIR